MQKNSTTSNQSLLHDEFWHLLQKYENGLDDIIVREHFQSGYSAELTSVINALVASNRIQLYTTTSNKNGEMGLVYKLVKEETALKFEGLGPEQILVYQIIERASNKGIWTRDIKIATNIQQQQLTKTLKTLESRNLIKSVRSVVSKSKKLYMLYNLEPAKEISGGPWYTDQEFDHEFFDLISNEIVKYVRSQNVASIDHIVNAVLSSGISTIQLTKEEITLVVQTLVYDGRLQEVGNDASSRQMYKVTRISSFPSYFSDVPCGVCPVIHKCKSNGIISPQTCEYMDSWISMEPEAYQYAGGW